MIVGCEVAVMAVLIEPYYPDADYDNGQVIYDECFLAYIEVAGHA